MAQTRTFSSIGISDNGSLHFDFTNGDGQEFPADADTCTSDVSQAESDQCMVQARLRLEQAFVITKAAQLEAGTYTSDAGVASALSAQFVGKSVKVDYSDGAIVTIS